MENIFKRQMELAVPFILETLVDQQNKFYYSGREKKVGDTQLWAVFAETEDSDEMVMGTLELSEYGTVYRVLREGTDFLPILVKI